MLAFIFSKNFTMKKILVLAITILIFSSCAVIRPGEVGIKQRLGKLNDSAKEQGVIVYNPFVSKVIKVPTRTINKEIKISLPSKEGLTIESDISILYRIKAERTKTIIEDIGTDYEKIITAVFRSAAADICARFYAKDMHSGERLKIEQDIARKMNELVGERGFEIEAVLLKSIVLPPGLARAIEEKLEAEQNAQRMQFVLQTERQEAERKKIEATGTKDAQLIITEGLTDKILELRRIEAMQKLSLSNNSKVIVTDNGNNLILKVD